MTTAQNVLKLASIFIGLEATPGSPSPFGHWYGERNREFWSAPWCAMFVSFCTYNTGMPLLIDKDNLKGFAYCPFGVKWFQERGRWHTENPQPGDIVFYDFDGKGVEHTEHTGIVKSVGQNSITAIEGNTSDANQANGGAVQEKTRAFSPIVGFGRPAYDGKDIGAIAKEVPSVPAQLISVADPLFSSPDVLKWKQQMQRRGWLVAEPNNPAFTVQDRDLLIEFQTLWNLEPDGKLGAMSWVLTWLMPITTGIMKQGDYGDGVYRLQETLKKAGFSLTADGEFGTGTEAIVKQFQEQKHLTVNGQVGKEVLAQLRLNFHVA